MSVPREVTLNQNQQPIEKYRDSNGIILSVHSIFYTIQGEGPFSGHPAVFVRLAGCNLQCPGCDTDYTVGRKEMSMHDVVDQVFFFNPLDKPCLVVITGGEPFRQNITPLCKKLLSAGFTVQVETNGTLAPPEDFPSKVVVICSPKTGKVSPKLLSHINAFKYVLSADSLNDADGLPVQALGHTASPQLARPPKDNTRPIYVQPMDPKDEVIYKVNVDAVKASCMKHGYILQLQTHKIIDVE